jgi:hypothetical protein
MLENVIGNPLETTIALSHLIFEGTLDRFPGVKILAAHGGGYLPSYANRSDAGGTTFPGRLQRTWRSLGPGCSYKRVRTHFGSSLNPCVDGVEIFTDAKIFFSVAAPPHYHAFVETFEFLWVGCAHSHFAGRCELDVTTTIAYRLPSIVADDLKSGAAGVAVDTVIP